MNISLFESKNEKLTISNIINKNGLIEINCKSGLSYNKAYDKDFSGNSSKER